ncbi:MAG: FtsQ-type POTRA domain-containing protein [Candidatus Riflebacteria bacterium]|nr:FtsQ-type POTRA domain-containing protein [Candidatus Riflebacteria bacterium]
MALEEATRGRRPYPLPLKEGFSDSTEERIRNRRFRVRAQSLGRLAKPLMVVLSLALIALLSYLAIVQMKHLFFGTRYFEIRSIEVNGLNTVVRDDLLKFAHIAPGLNILTFDRSALRERLLQHPFVKEAEVSLRGMYTLKITVQERTPFMYVRSGTGFMEIAEDGVILTTEGFGEKEIPIITGLALNGKQAGDSLAEHDGFREARAWVASLSSPILAEISELNFASRHNPYIFLRTGIKLFPSGLDDLKNRFDYLRALLDNLKRNNVEPEYIDLRAPNEIVVKPRKPFRALEGSKQAVAGR